MRRKQRLQDGHISAWRRSGLTQSAYCRQHRLRPSTLASWLATQQEDTARPIELVPVPNEICLPCQNSGRGSDSTDLSLVVGRCRIEIGKQFDAGTFARLVAVLEGMQC